MLRVAQVAAYTTHKYSVGRTYNCWKLNLLVHRVTRRLNNHYTPSWTQILPTWFGNNISCTKYRNVHDISRRKLRYSSWVISIKQEAKKKNCMAAKFSRANK
jgi:hypothetical protein